MTAEAAMWNLYDRLSAVAIHVNRVQWEGNWRRVIKLRIDLITSGLVHSFSNPSEAGYGLAYGISPVILS